MSDTVCLHHLTNGVHCNIFIAWRIRYCYNFDSLVISIRSIDSITEDFCKKQEMPNPAREDVISL